MDKTPPTHPVKPWTFDDYTNSYIRRAAATGIYDIRGGGAKRKLPHFDDLLFLGASIRIIDVEVVKLARRPIAAELFRFSVASGAL